MSRLGRAIARGVRRAHGSSATERMSQGVPNNWSSMESRSRTLVSVFCCFIFSSRSSGDRRVAPLVRRVARAPRAAPEDQLVPARPGGAADRDHPSAGDPGTAAAEWAADRPAGGESSSDGGPPARIRSDASTQCDRPATTTGEQDHSGGEWQGRSGSAAIGEEEECIDEGQGISHHRQQQQRQHQEAIPRRILGCDSHGARVA